MQSNQTGSMRRADWKRPGVRREMVFTSVVSASVSLQHKSKSCRREEKTFAFFDGTPTERFDDDDFVRFLLRFCARYNENVDAISEPGKISKTINRETIRCSTFFKWKQFCLVGTGYEYLEKGPQHKVTGKSLEKLNHSGQQLLPSVSFERRST